MPLASPAPNGKSDKICPVGLERYEDGRSWCSTHSARMVDPSEHYENMTEPTTHQKNVNPQTF